MISNKQFVILPYEEKSKPVDYPIIEDYPELLFYIQRNQNHNTVIYEVNYTSDQLLNLNDPIRIHWLRFSGYNEVEKQNLNYIQKKLAYGYRFNIISNTLLSFEIISYDEIKFFLGKDERGRYRAFFIENDTNVILESIYIYAEDLGVFPQVKWAEIYGKVSGTEQKILKRIEFDNL